MDYSIEDIEALIAGIYRGLINPLSLPEDLYLAIAKKLIDGVREGFDIQIQFGAEDRVLLAQLEENTYLFSAAKTFQQVSEMTNMRLAENGKLVPFEEFKKQTQQVFNKYNGGEDTDGIIKPGWLEAEYNTAISQAGHAAKWLKIQEQKELLPFLLRNEVTDALECNECASVNGVCLPVDHPFWNENAGDLHFNCRGVVEQLDQEEGELLITDELELQERLRNRITDDFKYNPGKRGEIFLSEGPNKHPYFDIPDKYKGFAANNFNLPIPE